VKSSPTEPINSLRFLDIYQQRITVFQEAFNEERDELLSTALHVMEDMTESAVQQEEHLKAVIFQQGRTHEASSQIAICLHSARVDELSNNVST